MPYTQNRALETFAELSEFGSLANNTDDLDLLLTRACKTVSQALGTDMAKILECLPEDKSKLRVRALHGFGGEAESQFLEVEKNSGAGYALKTRKPVISEDMRQETRYHLNSLEK